MQVSFFNNTKYLVNPSKVVKLSKQATHFNTSLAISSLDFRTDEFRIDPPGGSMTWDHS